MDMQLLLIESLEEAHRGAIPRPSDRLVEGANAWKTLYNQWKAGRIAKMEHPPDTTSLELVRLFVSPRFKLISHMQWPAVEQVFEATRVRHERDTRARGNILVLYRTSEKKWRINILGILKKTEKTVITHRSKTINVDGTRNSADVETSFSDTHGMVIDGRIVGLDVLFYGRASVFISEKSYANHNAMQGTLSTLGGMFFNEIRLDRRPTPQALGWRNKLVVIRGQFLPISLEDIDFAILYTPGTTEDPSAEVTVSFTMHMARHSQFTESDPLLSQVVTVAHHRGMVAIKARGVTPPPKLTRMGIKWPNGMFMWLTDSKFPSHNLKEMRLSDLRTSFEKTSEPVVSDLVDISEWGYTGTMHMPMIPRPDQGLRPVPGVLLMPAPWFFYYMRRFAEKPLAFAKGLFSYNPSGIAMMTLDSDYIRAHQPFELIFLPDELDIRSLEDLAMLQRKNIPERATAPLVEEEVEML